MSADRPTRGKIIVFGFLFGYPLPGVIYQFLHYLLGLRQLGYDPYYVEDSERPIYNRRSNEFSLDVSANIEAAAPILQAHGFGNRWAFRGCFPGGRCHGLTEVELLALYRDADAMLNVTGAQELREEHMACPRRIYVESDPFVDQVRVAQGDDERITALSAHDMHFTFGENLHAPDCDVPIERFQWLPTRQPVALDLWQGSGLGGASYNTITTWSNKGRSIQYRGDTFYWTKDREFKPFLDLPTRREVPFELATAAPSLASARILKNGWGLVDSREISRSMDSYRDYILRSRGEFTVARDQYVRPKTGWFSDRSACYLAAGRPVITQETGFSKFLPTGKGLFAFTTMDDVLAAIDEIETDYPSHCAAAKEIAAESFCAERVLRSLMERAGL